MKMFNNNLHLEKKHRDKSQNVDINFIIISVKKITDKVTWRIYFTLTLISWFPSKFPSLEEDVLQEETTVLHLLLAHQQRPVHPVRGGGFVPAPPAGEPSPHHPHRWGRSLWIKSCHFLAVPDSTSDPKMDKQVEHSEPHCLSDKPTNTRGRVQWRELAEVKPSRQLAASCDSKP